MSTPTFEYVTLTTQMAQTILEKNHLNRPVKPRVVTEYATEMLAGRWHFTAEAIKIDKHGNLLDGQHRCMALVQANGDLPEGATPLTIPVLLARGLETEAQDAMDSGTRRSVADQIARRGASNWSQIGAAARCVLAFKQNTNRPPRAEVITLFDENREMFELGVPICSSYNNTSGITASSLLAAWFLITEVCNDEEAVNTFFHMLRTGADVPENSPIMALRNRANTARMRREAIANHVATGLVIRTWNAWRTGASLTKFPLRSRGEMIEVKKIES